MTKIEHAHKHRSDFRFDHDGMWPHHHDYETDQPIWWEGPIPAPAEATAAAEQRLDALEGALSLLLEDTEHKDHDCGDEEWCPVRRARALLDSPEKT